MKVSADQRSVPNEAYLSIVLVAGIGMFLTTLDSGVLNVAISSLVQEFHSTVSTVAWTISLYTIVICGCIVVFGRLSDRYGRLNIYSLGLALFALASLLCAFSETVMQLIAFRILQGIGAAMLQATSAALITTLVSPAKKGEALGALATFFGLGHVLGPVAGGMILSTAGWEWLFLINIPICLLCLLACRNVLKGKESPINRHQPLNLSGSLGLCCMLVPLLILALLTPNWHLSIVCFMLFVYGSGAGLFQPSNIAAIMETVGPAHQATIGAVQRLAQNIGSSLFTAVTAGFLQAPAHDVWVGSRNSFCLAAAATFIGIIGFIMVKQFGRSRAIPE